MAEELLFHGNCFRNVFIRHVAKMKYLNLEVDKRDLQTIDNHEGYRDYHNRCLQEINSMEATKFYNNSPISILLRKRKVISGHARNEEMMEAFKGRHYESKFPIYFDTLKMENRHRSKEAEVTGFRG